jgi:hypothetical protein
MLDPATGTVRSTLGSLASVAVGAGWIVWTDAACLATGRCPLHRTDLIHHTTITRDYLLPANPDVPTGTTFSGGTISSDGAAGLLIAPARSRPPVHTYNHPEPPFDIAVLHLDTGALDVIPGIELAPKSGLGLAFSADNRWLAIALNEGTHTRLLIWRRGLGNPLQPPIQLPGPVLYAPPMTPLAAP